MKNPPLFMIAAALGGAIFGFSQPILAQDPPPSGAPVEERLEGLDQRLRALERRLEPENTSAKPKETPVLGAGGEGFFLKSAEGAFQLKLRGYLQADTRIFLDDENQPGTTTFLLRRVRPIFEGTVSQYLDFRIMPDFGEGKTVLQDAYLDARYWNEVRLRVGKFKEPVGLERLQSGADLLFVERALPTNLVPNRDLGVQLYGDLLEGSLSYALGIFNGVQDGGSADIDTDDDKDFAGRIFLHPFKRSAVEPLKGLGIGVAGTSGNQKGSPSSPNLPSFKTPGQQTFFSYRSDVLADGKHFRVSPQAYYYWGPFGLLAEYVLSSQEVQIGVNSKELKNEAWQVAVSYVLTGEPASYKGVRPKRPFDPKHGTWGAFEIATRYSDLQIDEDAFPVFADPAKAAKEARAWAIGLNWYLNRNFKLVVDYEQTDFEAGSSKGDREQEKVLLSRFQIAY